MKKLLLLTVFLMMMSISVFANDRTEGQVNTPSSDASKCADGRTIGKEGGDSSKESTKTAPPAAILENTGG